MVWTNIEKKQYLLKEDLGMILKEDGGGILINTPIGSDNFANQSKNSATFSNTSRTSANWTNINKS